MLTIPGINNYLIQQIRFFITKNFNDLLACEPKEISLNVLGFVLSQHLPNQMHVIVQNAEREYIHSSRICQKLQAINNDLFEPVFLQH